MDGFIVFVGACIRIFEEHLEVLYIKDGVALLGVTV